MINIEKECLMNKQKKTALQIESCLKQIFKFAFLRMRTVIGNH